MSKCICHIGDYAVKDAKARQRLTAIEDKFAEGYIKPKGSREILTNGEHDVTEVKTVIVNVPTSEAPTGELVITSPGRYDVSGYASVFVDIEDKTEEFDGSMEIA